MTIMPFEGLQYEALEDVTGTDFALEPTHTEADEAYYVNDILPGWHDDAEQDFADWREETYDPDGYEADRACDRWERSYWGD